MKSNILLLVALVLTLITSCSKETITGSGEVVSEFRNVALFTKVSSQGVFEVTITQGTSQSVQIIGDDNIIHEVETEVEDDELRLYLDDDYNYRNLNVQVKIVVPNLTGIRNYGVGNISISGVDTSDTFNVFNSGTGDISIEGKANNLTLKNEGTGMFDGFLFTVNEGSINSIGTGDCKVNCANKLTVRIEGSGNVYYKGSPSIDADITGVGKIINSN